MSTKREQFRQWLRDREYGGDDEGQIADAAARIWEQQRTGASFYCGDCGWKMLQGTTECSNEFCIRNLWIREENEATEALKENQ